MADTEYSAIFYAVPKVGEGAGRPSIAVAAGRRRRRRRQASRSDRPLRLIFLATVRVTETEERYYKSQQEGGGVTPLPQFLYAAGVRRRP